MPAALSRRQAWGLFWLLAAAVLAWLFLAVWPDWLNAILISKKAFVSAILNGITLAGLYFLVASGFTLIFGLMRNVNLAHGSLYLLGAYIGYEVTTRTGYWLLGVAAGFAVLALVGVVMQVVRLPPAGRRRPAPDPGHHRHLDRRRRPDAGGVGRRHLPAADAGMARRRGQAADHHRLQVERRRGLPRLSALPPGRAGGAIVIGVGLWLMLNRTRVGMMIRAGVDDRAMLSATGVNVHVVFAIVFALGAGLAGFAGVVGGSALSVAPGEDVRYLLASLVVVIVGGMGSITGAAIGALLIGLAEQIGLVYFPTYGIVLTFVIMVVALAVRPQGIMGKAR